MARPRAQYGSELWEKQENDRQVVGKQDSVSPDSVKALERRAGAISLEKSREAE